MGWIHGKEFNADSILYYKMIAKAFLFVNDKYY